MGFASDMPFNVGGLVLEGDVLLFLPAFSVQLAVDDLVDRLHPLAHGLALDRLEEGIELAQQMVLVPLKVIPVLVHPVSQHIQHSAPAKSKHMEVIEA